MASVAPIGRERRTEDRTTVDLPITMRAYRVAPIDARMIDLSAGGALIALASDAAGRGDEVLVAALGIELVATIAWSKEGFAGLAFHRKLAAPEINALRKAGRPRSAH